MSSPSPNSLFARKGRATPTPVPEDSIGFISGQSNDFDDSRSPMDDASSTVVSFRPTAPVGDSVPGGRPEAASMLGIRLTSRENLSRPPAELEAGEENPPASAHVAILPLPDNTSMVVVDAPEAANERGWDGKWQLIVATLSVLVAILAGSFIYDARESQVPQSIITKTIPTPHPMPIPPEALVTPDQPMVPSEIPVAEKEVAATPKIIGPYSVQLGSLPSSKDAARELKTLKQRFGGKLSGLDLRVVAGSVSGKGRVWRIRAVGLPSAEAASRLCRNLGVNKTACLALKRR